MADGEIVRMGHVHVAPPDANMVLERGRIVVQRSPRESFHRPSINALFRSAAMSCGRRVVGVVLTGTLEDGGTGSWEIWRRGGIVIVQDPGEAQWPDLPQRVLQAVSVDYTARMAGSPSWWWTSPRAGRTPSVAGDSHARVMIVEDERIVAKSLENELQAETLVAVKRTNAYGYGT